MKWKDLGNPFPRREPIMYAPFEWAERQAIRFDDVPLSQLWSRAPTYSSIVESRQSRYGFGELSMQELGALFMLTCKIRAEGDSLLGFPLTKRPAPSAGAIHPIHVVMHLPNYSVLHRYDPFGHLLLELNTVVDTAALRRDLNQVVDSEEGVLLMFVAEPGLTAAKYENAASLIWRDAGVLQGYFSMAAEALGLHFVPLGVTGEPWASGLASQAVLAGVGVALVGAPS